MVDKIDEFHYHHYIMMAKQENPREYERYILDVRRNSADDLSDLKQLGRAPPNLYARTPKNGELRFTYTHENIQRKFDRRDPVRSTKSK